MAFESIQCLEKTINHTQASQKLPEIEKKSSERNPSFLFVKDFSGIWYQTFGVPLVTSQKEYFAKTSVSSRLFKIDGILLLSLTTFSQANKRQFPCHGVFLLYSKQEHITAG